MSLDVGRGWSSRMDKQYLKSVWNSVWEEGLTEQDTSDCD